MEETQKVQPSPAIPIIGKVVPLSNVGPSIAGSITSAVSAGVAAKVTVPPGLKLQPSFNSDYFHGMVYGDTGAMKTTTAFRFGGPDRTFVVLTRSPEQLGPVSSLKPHYCVAEDSDALLFALQFPEKAADASGFPQWKDRADRVLMIDDMTEGTALIVDENSTKDDGSKVKSGLKIYGGTKDDIRSAMISLKKKQMHLVMTALAEVFASPIDNDETIFPAMFKGARAVITAELEYVLYIKHETKKMLTDRSFLTYTKPDAQGKPVMTKRDIFAKSKLDFSLINVVPPVIKKEEELDLAAFWLKVCSAKK